MKGKRAKTSQTSSYQTSATNLAIGKGHYNKRDRIILPDAGDQPSNWEGSLQQEGPENQRKLFLNPSGHGRLR